MKFKDDSPTNQSPESYFWGIRFGARRSTTHEYVILFKMLRVFCRMHQSPAKDVDKITHNTQHKKIQTHTNTQTPHTQQKPQYKRTDFFLKIVCYIVINKETNKTNKLDLGKFKI